MDPELAAALPMLPRIDSHDTAAARVLVARLMALAMRTWIRSDDAVEAADRTIPGSDDASIPIRVYRRRAQQAPVPAVVLLHGGGFAVGSLDAEHYKALLLAREAGFVVINVDYRLAPEHPYPVPLLDCYEALSWVTRHAGELGVDPGRLAVAGSSSGANLAAAVALLARDRGGPRVAFQQLIYPVLDDRMTTRSMREFAAPLGVDASVMWRQYIGDTDEDRQYAAPARATDLTGLPPAYILTAELDPFRDEGHAYALRLLESGVRVEVHCFPGAFHGFDTAVVHAAVSKRAMAEQIESLRRALCPPPARPRRSGLVNTTHPAEPVAVGDRPGHK
jgi:acetyl esterase/lipase